jgi:hypothetical protein
VVREILNWDVKRPRSHVEGHTQTQCPSVLKRIDEWGVSWHSGLQAEFGRIGALAADQVGSVMDLHS